MIELSAKIVEICRRYESKFSLTGGVLEGRFETTLIKKSLTLFAAIFFSVIDFYLFSKF